MTYAFSHNLHVYLIRVSSTVSLDQVASEYQILGFVWFMVLTHFKHKQSGEELVNPYEGLKRPRSIVEEMTGEMEQGDCLTTMQKQMEAFKR